MTFFTRLKPGSGSPFISRKGVLAAQREAALQFILNSSLLVYTLAAAATLLLSPTASRSGRPWIFLLVFLGIAGITISRKIHYALRAGVVVIAFNIMGAAALSSYGLSGTGIIFLFAGITLANLLFTRPTNLLFTLLSFGILTGMGWMMVSGRMALPPVEVMANSGKATQWATAVLVLVFAVGTSIWAFRRLLTGVAAALTQAEQRIHALETERVSLERSVEMHTADLRKRGDQFEIAGQIAREIAGETNLENLLNTAVNQIRDRFGFYHVGVFLNDERGEYAVLRAATGEAGRSMLDRNHRLKIGEIGLVGYAASRGEARIAMSVSGDALHYRHPLLPETRSEMALPLRAGGGTIGALDVQSVVENAFTQEDAGILQTIADQLAIAFEKTRLVEDLRRSLAELETSSQAVMHRAWKTHVRNTRQRLAYRYANDLVDTQVQDTPQAQEALHSGQPVFQTDSVNGQGKPSAVLAVPIRLRNQVLGVVDIQFERTKVSPELIALIESTVDRLAISLENARLLEDIQLRAAREQLVGEISSKVRAASDVDSVLRIAIQEIGQSLGVSEVMVQLRKGE